MGGFTTVDETTGFYVREDGTVVVCFPEYSIAAGAAGMPEFRPAAVERLHSWPERWNDALSGTLSGVTDFFDGLRPGKHS